MSQESIRIKLSARLHELCPECPVDCESDEAAGNVAGMLISTYGPHDRCKAFAGMLWAIDHPHDIDGVPSTAIAALMFLFTSAATASGIRTPQNSWERITVASPQDVHEQFRSWPRADAELVLRWLREIYTWPVIQDTHYCEDCEIAISYWEHLCARDA